MRSLKSVRPFHMSRSNLRTPLPIHFKFHRVIGIDGLTVCILYGEIFIPKLWDFIHQIDVYCVCLFPGYIIFNNVPKRLKFLHLNNTQFENEEISLGIE
jgi:hypothetical protein